MAGKEDKKEHIRQQIIAASHVYRDHLAGKVFLYVAGNEYFEGNKVNDWFLPRTLRVKDKAIENSSDAEFIDFIFCKDASMDKYDTVTYGAKDKKPPFIVREFLSTTLSATYF